MMDLITRLVNDEEGQGLVEYALIIVAVALVVFVGLKILGNSMNEKFNQIGEKIGEVTMPEGM